MVKCIYFYFFKVTAELSFKFMEIFKRKKFNFL